ncbi:outer membrane protein assembly factor BamD [Winogradskyella alexanderae]|uniref:Outer membrane protein assembly factor BamD n=1 Tax=Winogradskyella alexanderae TaxID=2877123 RepID=A0ABS7XUH1_9FLAO|nr:outer membrane protein assembly factor BamD [Winogradskyella alexanderae]MCA0133073.1 outer membrane protein assembly factor BamD [Winogradskyella alexanderae]
MRNLFYLLILTIFLSSCSDFQKALKSEDTAAKFKMGTELYEQGKFTKAHRLFEQILPNYRGKPQAEKLTFMHAMCSYEIGDYYIASYHFDKFVDIYPSSEKTEQAAFLASKGYYYNSPVHTKEQKDTVEAIEKLQIFINTYPNSSYVAEANKLVNELDYKLEKKAFEIAKQYNLITDYKASIKSFNNFLLEFPGTALREDAMFYRFDSAYRLAVLSIDQLKEERIADALSYYNSFKKAFPTSKYIEEADSMKEILENGGDTTIAKS